MMKFTLLCESWNGKEQYYCCRIHWTFFLLHWSKCYKSHGSSSRNLLQKCKRDPVPPNLGWKLAATVDKSHAMPAYVPGVTLSSVLAADMYITKRPLSLHVRVNGHLIVISMYSQTPLYGHPPKMDNLSLRTACFVPWDRKPLHFLYIQTILYGHLVNKHTFYGSSVSVLTEFDCSLSSMFVQNHSAEV